MENLEINAFDDLDFEVVDICSVDNSFGENEEGHSNTTRTLTTSLLI